MLRRTYWFKLEQEEIYGLVFQAERVTEEPSDSSTIASSDKGSRHFTGDEKGEVMGARLEFGFAVDHHPRAGTQSDSHSRSRKKLCKLSVLVKISTVLIKHREFSNLKRTILAADWREEPRNPGSSFLQPGFSPICPKIMAWEMVCDKPYRRKIY